MYRLSIKRIVIYTVLYNHRCQSRLIYKCTFSVRDRNPLSDTCRSFLFTAVYFLAISFQVIDFSTLCHQFDHLVESFVLGFWSTVDPDASLIQQFCDPHKFSFLTFLFVIDFLQEANSKMPYELFLTSTSWFQAFDPGIFIMFYKSLLLLLLWQNSQKMHWHFRWKRPF